MKTQWHSEGFHVEHFSGAIWIFWGKRKLRIGKIWKSLRNRPLIRFYL
jgi:hypothetical protein